MLRFTFPVDALDESPAKVIVRNRAAVGKLLTNMVARACSLRDDWSLAEGDGWFGMNIFRHIALCIALGYFDLPRMPCLGFSGSDAGR